MKKFISFITAAAALLAAMPMAANAEEAADERTYIPTVYFTSEAKTPAIYLAIGLLYVNTSDIEEINQLGYDNIYVESESEYKGIYIYDMFFI